MNDLFSDALSTLLAAQCTPAVVRAIEAGDVPAAAALWHAIEDSGFADALVPESLGGAGLALADAYGLFALCGTHAVPLPLGETLLARALLGAAGLRAPAGAALTFGQARVAADGGWTCTQVVCARTAQQVLAVDASGQARLLPVAAAEISAASFCLDATLHWPAAAVAAAAPLPGAVDLRTAEACLYAAQLAGAMTAVFEGTLRHANDRQQFGRPIGKFQAIQHQLAVISEHAFAARTAAQLGCRSEDDVRPDRLRAAVAKARTSESAVEVAALAHSIHGAIGFTQEFDLQLATRRLHRWRQAGGAESYWQQVVGQLLVRGHAGSTLDLIRQATDIH